MGEYLIIYTMATVTAVIQKFLTEYGNQTPKKLKIVDAYLVYILLSGIVQFVYHFLFCFQLFVRTVREICL